MFQTICQWLIIVQVVAGFVAMTDQDFNGRKARPPMGTPGFVATMIVVAIQVLIFTGSGAFDRLFGAS